MAQDTEAKPVPPTADLPWSELGFDYRDTNCHVRYSYKDGKWGPMEVVNEPYIKMHIMSGVMHYGQAVFEGFKVFRTKDQKAAAFAPHFSHERMARGCERLAMPQVPSDIFNESVETVVKKNAEFIPPYDGEGGGALYVRPVVFSTGTNLHLSPATEYVFLVFVCPVGSYYKNGVAMIDGGVTDKFDRAAPLGVGGIKCAGNYAADMVPAREMKAKHFAITLYLDAARHEFVEEFSTSNFVAIDAAGSLVTPDSKSILGSHTNKIIQQCAKDMGIKVERRPIPWSEVSTLKEVVACGTAVVLTPLRSLTRGDERVEFGDWKTFQKLYTRVRQIQLGEKEETHGWMKHIEC